MKQNEQLIDVKEMLLSRQLGKGIRALENYLLTSQRQQDMSQLESIKNDYELMTDYWQRGYDDPQREQVCNQLLRRMFVLTSNIETNWQIAETPFLKATYQRPRRRSEGWSLDGIKQMMETFVSDVALLELEPEHTRQQKSSALYASHFEQMRDLFDYILTSRQWRDSQADAFLGMLLSPTLASVDQQLIVSAITLSAMQHFCFQKFRVLIELYRQATDERLRQRALVGWVLTASSERPVWQLYTEMVSLMDEVCQDERTQTELAELQMQLVYCQQADADRDTIQKEILPDIMSGSKLKVSKGGLVEMDEDSLDDMLHPEASELAVERMEQSVKRMADMQKQGTDIYFGGFSQMKRFPFFNDICNWFVPFYAQHPGISQTWNNARAGKFLKTITRMGAFCDSDKYSFVLAFDQVLDRLPQGMLKMIEQGEAMAMPVGGEVALEEQRQPAFIRRTYLQNLYRFFRIFPARAEFCNPFDDGTMLFFAKGIFGRNELAGQAVAVARFLMKRQRYEQARDVLVRVPQDRYDANAYVLLGSALQHIADSDPLMTENCYRQALALQPGHVRATAGLARSLFERHQYEEALECYQQLALQQPDHRTFLLNAAVCQLNVGQDEEALKSLYKLNYLYPDDLAVTRVLAWALTATGKYEQADKMYAQLLSTEKPFPQDMLNQGYNHWFQHRVKQAIDMFRRYRDSLQDDDFSLEQEFMTTEHQLLSTKGISDAEILLMVDAVGQ